MNASTKTKKTQENIKGKTWLREHRVPEKICFVNQFNCLPLKITVLTAVMWTKPVHEDPVFKILMKAPICFQGAAKPEKAQCSQMQKHLLFQHLRAHFSFYDPFGKQCLLQRTKIILSSGTPRHGSGPRSKSPAPDLGDAGELNEGDMSCHAGNTSLGRKQPCSGLELQLSSG